MGHQPPKYQPDYHGEPARLSRSWPSHRKTMQITVQVAPKNHDDRERRAFRSSIASVNATLVGRPYNSKRDRKSTRLNSSHANISYAVFCLKKKKLSKITNT